MPYWPSYDIRRLISNSYCANKTHPTFIRGPINLSNSDVLPLLSRQLIPIWIIEG